MKKLVILIGLFIVLAIVFLMFMLVGKKSEDTSIVSPTPTSTQVSGAILESSNPTNNAINVARNQEVVFTFSQAVTDKDIKILVGPDTGQAILYRGKTVIVRPVPMWNEGTPYRISIEYSDPARIPQGINFTVAGRAPDTLPDTAPNPTAIKQSEDLQRDENPDVYLSNYTPYDTQKFTITSQFKTTPTGHFAFTVATKGEASLEVVKSEIKAWALSHGLSESQFQSLDISYQ